MQMLWDSSLVEESPPVYLHVANTFTLVHCLENRLKCIENSAFQVNFRPLLSTFQRHSVNGGRPWKVYHSILFQWLSDCFSPVRHAVRRYQPMYLPDPTYLSTSRLGIYYFRFPIPITFHPEGKASDLKLSLRTKNKRLALCLSNALRLVSENILEQPEVQQMDYQTIRSHVQSHFKSRLSAFRDAVMTGGPIGDERKAGLSALIVAAKSDRATFINHTYLDDQPRLVAEFCEQQNIPCEFSEKETDVLLTAYQAANLQLAEAVLAFNAEQAQFDLLGAPQSHTETHTAASAVLGQSVVPDRVDRAHATSGDSLSGVAEQHLKEGIRGDLWVPKTLSEKREALTLLSELLEGRTIQSITKPDARIVKDKISRLPKNRNKSPLTKDLSLEAQIGRWGQCKGRCHRVSSHEYRISSQLWESSVRRQTLGS